MDKYVRHRQASKVYVLKDHFFMKSVEDYKEFVSIRMYTQRTRYMYRRYKRVVFFTLP